MIKQVILVPTYLGMSPGKIVSQCCHVAVPFGIDSTSVQKRIILKVESKAHLETLRKLHDFVWNSHRGDPGWREFIDSAPTTEGTEGKVTAISIVGQEENVDLVTGHLELL